MGVHHAFHNCFYPSSLFSIVCFTCFHWNLPLGLFLFCHSPLFQSILLLLIIKKTNQNLQRPSPYPTHLWVKPVKVLTLLIVAIRVIYFSFFCCCTQSHISLLLCLVWMWLALNQESVNKHWRSALHVMRLTDWLACFSRLWGVEEAGRQDSDEGKQLLSPGENIWESSDQSSSCTACPRPRGLDIQIWWK